MSKLKSVHVLILVSSALLAACGSVPSPERSPATIELYPKITQTVPRLQSPAASGEFPEFFRRATEGPRIPGLVEGAVPQGLAYLPRGNLLLVSAYFDEATPSAVLAVDAASGKLEKTIWLAAGDGEPLHGHVGGIAAGPQALWIASDDGVYRYSPSDFAAAKDGSILSARAFYRTAVVASSATYSDGVLWIGEFAYYGPGGGQYRTEPSHHLAAPDGSAHHALAAGYRIEQSSGAIDGSRPDYLLSIPDRVQGIALVGSDIYLSISYGRRNDSTLERYERPLEGPPAGALAVGSASRTPYWFLDRAHRIASLVTPPMMEGIVPVAGRLYLLFESGAGKYRYTGRASVDRLFSIALR